MKLTVEGKENVEKAISLLKEVEYGITHKPEIGDRVRLKEDAKYQEGSGQGECNPPAGTCGKVINIEEWDDPVPYIVKWDGDYVQNCYPESDLEVIV